MLRIVNSQNSQIIHKSSKILEKDIKFSKITLLIKVFIFKRGISHVNDVKKTSNETLKILKS